MMTDTVSPTPAYDMDFVRKRTIARLQKVRERLAKEAEEQAKLEREADIAKRQMEKRKKKQEQVHANSEEARRQRCYTLYTKLGTPSRTHFLKKIKEMPFEHHQVELQDVELLPWQDGGKRVDLTELFSLLF